MAEDQPAHVAHGQARSVSRVVAAALALVLAYAAWMGHAAFRQGQDAADSSCLASIHSELISLHLLESGVPKPEWRDWSASEVARVFPRLQAGDCDYQRRWLPQDLGIRTRTVQDGRTEFQLWRKSRPDVSSP